MKSIRVYRVRENPSDNWDKVFQVNVFRQEYYDMTKDDKWLVPAHEDGFIPFGRLDNRHSIDIDVSKLIQGVYFYKPVL